MALTLTGVQTAADVWQLTVAGVDPAASPTFTVDWGDATGGQIVTTHASGTTVVSHTYRDPGHRSYTVLVTASKTPYAATLQALNSGAATLQAINTAVPTLADISANTLTATLPVSVDVGPATISATVVAASPIPVIRLDTYVANQAAVLQWTISRNVPTSAPIYIGTGTTYAVSLYDTTAPLGVDISYTLTITYSDYTSTIVTSNTVRITGTAGCWLTDPISGITLGVQLQAWPARVRAGRRALLDVMARPDPVALSDVHTLASGVWTFITLTDADTSALISLLVASTFAVLRTQPGSSIPSVTVSVGDISENRFSGRGGDARRLTDVAVQEIAALPATSLPLNATLGGLATVDGATLGSLSQFRPSLLALSQVVTGSGVPVAAAV